MFKRFKRIVEGQLALLQRKDSEASVVAKVIFPILTEGLRISPFDVRLEESLLGTSSQHKTGRADIVVRMANKPVLVVECKAPNKSFRWETLRREANEQAERYATELQVDYVLLTNGYQWILTKGRSIVAEAYTQEEFVIQAREFYEWLKPKSLWYSATNLIIPPDFETGIKILARCDKLAVTSSDIRTLARMRKDMPHIVPRLEEEVRKALAVIEIDKFTKKMPYQRSLSVIHMDPTFLKYRQGAWLYDPIYIWHRSNQADFLRYCAKSDPKRTSLRAFIVSKEMTADWAVRLPNIGRQMLREGWTVTIIYQEILGAFELEEGDVVGEYATATYHEGDAFGYRFERSPKIAKRFREKVNDYMAANTNLTFHSSERDIARLEENCHYLARTKT